MKVVSIFKNKKPDDDMRDSKLWRQHKSNETDDMAARLGRIKASLERINELMTELKKKEKRKNR